MADSQQQAQVFDDTYPFPLTPVQHERILRRRKMTQTQRLELLEVQMEDVSDFVNEVRLGIRWAKRAGLAFLGLQGVNLANIEPLREFLVQLLQP